MEYMGIRLDAAVNDGMRGEEKVLSTPDSKVTVIVVPTDEEYMIASDTQMILEK
jgi:acetate kinase